MPVRDLTKSEKRLKYLIDEKVYLVPHGKKYGPDFESIMAKKEEIEVEIDRVLSKYDALQDEIALRLNDASDSNTGFEKRLARRENDAAFASYYKKYRFGSEENESLAAEVKSAASELGITEPQLLSYIKGKQCKICNEYIREIEPLDYYPRDEEFLMDDAIESYAQNSYYMAQLSIEESTDEEYEYDPALLETYSYIEKNGSDWGLQGLLKDNMNEMSRQEYSELEKLVLEIVNTYDGEVGEEPAYDLNDVRNFLRYENRAYTLELPVEKRPKSDVSKIALKELEEVINGSSILSAFMDFDVKYDQLTASDAGDKYLECEIRLSKAIALTYDKMSMEDREAFLEVAEDAADNCGKDFITAEDILKFIEINLIRKVKHLLAIVDPEEVNYPKVYDAPFTEFALRMKIGKAYEKCAEKRKLSEEIKAVEELKANVEPEVTEAEELETFEEAMTVEEPMPEAEIVEADIEAEPENIEKIEVAVESETAEAEPDDIEAVESVIEEEATEKEEAAEVEPDVDSVEFANAIINKCKDNYNWATGTFPIKDKEAVLNADFEEYLNVPADENDAVFLKWADAHNKEISYYEAAIDIQTTYSLEGVKYDLNKAYELTPIDAKLLIERAPIAKIVNAYATERLREIAAPYDIQKDPDVKENLIVGMADYRDKKMKALKPKKEKEYFNSKNMPISKQQAELEYYRGNDVTEYDEHSLIGNCFNKNDMSKIATVVREVKIGDLDDIDYDIQTLEFLQERLLETDPWWELYSSEDFLELNIALAKTRLAFERYRIAETIGHYDVSEEHAEILNCGRDLLERLSEYKARKESESSKEKTRRNTQKAALAKYLIDFLTKPRKYAMSTLEISIGK